MPTSSSPITFAPTAFIRLTRASGKRSFATLGEVLRTALAGAEAGCHGALLTLGARPERDDHAAREELAGLGWASGVEFLAAMCSQVLEETGLVPHADPGAVDRDELVLLRGASACHSVTLVPASGAAAQQLETLALAGELQMPFTVSVRTGLGEPRAQRVAAFQAIRALHDRFGHIQEVIVGGSRPSPLDELLWTVAAARAVLGATINLRVAANATPFGQLRQVLDAGINDWGCISPVTIDHVEPEARWPALERLRAATEEAGFALAARLPLYPEFVEHAERWCSPDVQTALRRRADAQGLGREDPFVAGVSTEIAANDRTLAAVSARGPLRGPSTNLPVDVALAKVDAEISLELADVEALFTARGSHLGAVFRAADRLRRETSGDEVTYVVTRNINYTNVCYFRCGFCAFSKGKLANNLRGPSYLVPHEEIVRRCHEAWDRGAVEVCLQGGIHPGFDGNYYCSIVEAIKGELPDLHLHAFSALEIWQGAATLDMSVPDYLARLRSLGLASLPGTAAEVLDDEVRAVLCPDKINTEQWLDVHDAAHRAGLGSNATVMFGHVDTPRNWARHLLAVRDQQARTGGFTEFVPLPFVHVEAPIYLKGRARRGPTLREAILMHAVPRLALHPHITNIQASWPKLGIAGGQLALRAGANDFGGTLMNESISRAAGARHGQEMPPEAIDAAIRSVGRVPRQRTTRYGHPPPERTAASYNAAPLIEPDNPRVSADNLSRPRVLLRSGIGGAHKARSSKPGDAMPRARA